METAFLAWTMLDSHKRKELLTLVIATLPIRLLCPELNSYSCMEANQVSCMHSCRFVKFISANPIGESNPVSEKNSKAEYARS